MKGLKKKSNLQRHHTTYSSMADPKSAQSITIDNVCKIARALSSTFIMKYRQKLKKVSEKAAFTGKKKNTDQKNHIAIRALNIAVEKQITI